MPSQIVYQKAYASDIQQYHGGVYFPAPVLICGFQVFLPVLLRSCILNPLGFLLFHYSIKTSKNPVNMRICGIYYG